MLIGHWDAKPGKVHKQLEGEDLQEYTLTAEVQGGRTMTLKVLLPFGAQLCGTVGQELVRRANTIAALFEGTPFAIAYDGLSASPPDVATASRHTDAVVGKAVGDVRGLLRADFA